MENQTLEQVRAQLAELKRVEEELVAKYKADAIAQIKSLMEQYEVSIEDLSGNPKKPAPILYRGPNGETWSGRGRPPRWLSEQLANGKTLADFKI